MAEEIFKQVYPFTTENLAGYFPILNLKNKTVLTTGSSLDQAFNALVYGAKNVCVYDINKNVEEFYQYKRNLVLNKDMDDFCVAVFQTDIPCVTWQTPVESLILRNTYLQSPIYYEKLRERLEENNISFINGDIFEFDKYLGDQAFDRIILSNILSYIDFFALERDIDDEFELLKSGFNSWENHLNNDGLLQLMYYYEYNPILAEKDSIYDILRIHKALKRELKLELFSAAYARYPKDDGVLIYQKKIK